MTGLAYRAAQRRPAAGRTLDRFLRLFSDIRPGEGTTAILLTLNVFLILTAYLMIKPVRDALILAQAGAEVRSYAAAAQALLLLGLVPAYAALAGKFPRRQLINRVTWFFVGCLGVFYLLARSGVAVGVVFFLWVGIFNLMVPAQFWAFANDVYSEEEGKRLFPVVAFGASFGAVIGSVIAGRLIGPLGVSQLLLVAGAILAASLLLTNAVDARERRRTEAHLSPSDSSAELPAISPTGPPPSAPPAGGSGDTEPVDKRGAFRLVLTNRYLLLIALLILVLNWVNTTGEYILGRTVSQAAAAAVAAGTAGSLTQEGLITRFYSGYYSVINLTSLLLQLFVVSRIIKYAGVRSALLFLPFIAFAGYAVLAFYPVLTAIRWAKTAENATDYSLQNTVRQILFLPTTREEKYKAKQAIDSFFMRAGDVLSAAVVYLGTTYLALSPQKFALVNLGLVVVWLLLAALIGREYVRRAAPAAARAAVRSPVRGAVASKA